MGEKKVFLIGGGVKRKEGRGDNEKKKKKVMADFCLGGEKVWLGPWSHYRRVGASPFKQGTTGDGTYLGTCFGTYLGTYTGTYLPRVPVLGRHERAWV